MDEPAASPSGGTPTPAKGHLENTQELPGTSHSPRAPLQEVDTNSETPKNECIDQADAQKAFEKTLRHTMRILSKRRMKHQVSQLEVQSDEQLEKVGDLVMERGLTEARPTAIYARFCCELLNQLEQANESSEGPKAETFKKMLRNRCLQEFQRVTEKTRETRKREKAQAETERWVKLEATKTDRERRELQETFDEADAAVSRRRTGVGRFLGRLYKFGILDFQLIYDCLYKLMSDPVDNDLIVCAGRLFSHAGKTLADESQFETDDDNNRKQQYDELIARLNTIIDDNREAQKENREHLPDPAIVMLEGIREFEQAGWTTAKTESPERNPDSESKPADDPAPGDAAEAQEQWNPNTELYKKFNVILRSLTPQNFNGSVDQVRQLEINSKERLDGVTDLVLERGVEESAPMCAQFCREILNEFQVAKDNPESSSGSTTLNFRKMLLQKCQEEFKKVTEDSPERAQREKVQMDDRKVKLDAAQSDEERKKLQKLFDEQDSQVKRRTLSLMRFIGELYNLSILNSYIMYDGLSKLLTNSTDEDSIVCACKLFTTVGKKLAEEAKRPAQGNEQNAKPQERLNELMEKMKEIIRVNRQPKGSDDKRLPPRVRFMLEDVVELEKRGWIPRHSEQTPKTVEQIRQDVENELNQASSSQGPSSGVSRFGTVQGNTSWDYSRPTGSQSEQAPSSNYSVRGRQLLGQLSRPGPQ